MNSFDRRKKLTGQMYKKWVKSLMRERRSVEYVENDGDLGDVDDESELQENVCEEECKSTAITDYAEYWVPVRLSNLQTEQYCSFLFSNSVDLCSTYSFDPIKTLHDILVSTKKCCDHPYLVDRSLHASFIEGIPQSEQLDAQIKWSGKLLLLSKVLQEINKRGLRALVLYQSLGRSEPVTIGDILDDIIYHKFGEDSFVRIDGLIHRSKKQAVLNSFNDKQGGKFVCLMEIHNCVQSITLKSIDTVIFFNSDWDPMTDLKALQRINLDSQHQQVTVFRLYSAYTVEEKVLILTKQGTAPEGTLRNIKRSACHELLTWGAYFLFQKLDDFHKDSSLSDGESTLEDVFNEVCILLPKNEKRDVNTKNSLVLEVEQIGGVYNTNISLLGEVEYPLIDGFSVIEDMLFKEPPYVFWANILEGRKPRWKYFSSPSSRRKCVQIRDDFPESCVGASKKRRTGSGSTPSITRRRRRRNRLHRHQGEAAAVRRKETPLVDSPSSIEFLSQTNHQQEELSPQTPHRRKVLSEPEIAQVTQSEVLQSPFKALQLELERLQNQKAEYSKQHEDMKIQTIMARAIEIDQVYKKYEEMLQNADTTFHQEVLVLETRYNKILANKALAESLIKKNSAALSQETFIFSLEQAYQLILQQPSPSSTAITGAAEEGILQPCILEASLDLHIPAGCLTAPAPHFRQVGQSPLSAVSPQQFKRPGVIYSPVTLQKEIPTSGTSR